jgi:crotonobetaine/carnitine-CoA ligase
MTAVFSDPPKPDDADNPVRLVISSGMPKAIWAEFELRFQVQIFEFYAAIEGGMSVKPIGIGPIGSIGKPPSHLNYRIVDENGDNCPPGTPGELLFQPADGSPAKVEYYRNPEASAAKIKDGWLHMGDIVVADQDGWLFFLHRKGGAIRRNGEFINSGFIEKVIAENDTVDDVYVYGIPSTNGTPGEKEVVAAIVPKDRSGFNPENIYKICRQKLEPSQIPAYLQVLDVIPKTASEKPQDRFLIELFQTQPATIFRENHD